MHVSGRDSGTTRWPTPSAQGLDLPWAAAWNEWIESARLILFLRWREDAHERVMMDDSQ